MKRNEKTIKLGSIILIVIFFITLICGTTLNIINGKTIEYTEKSKFSFGVLDKESNYHPQDDLTTIGNDNIKSLKLNFEYSNTKENIQEENQSINLYANLYINSILFDNKFASLNLNELLSNKSIKIQDAITNINYELEYDKILTEVKNFINSQNLSSQIKYAIIELVVVSSNLTDKNDPRSIIDITMPIDDSSIKPSVVQRQVLTKDHTKSTTFATLLIIGSVFMIALGGYGLYYSFKSSKLTDFEYSKKHIFNHNKDSLIQGNITDEEINKATVINSFDELLKIQSIVSLPILYKEINDGYSFLIKVGSNSYTYTLTK